MPGTEWASAASRSITVVTPSRSSLSFRLMRKRPLLRVVLVPSTPMKDDRLPTPRPATAFSGVGRGRVGPRRGRIAQHLVGDGALAVGHLLERHGRAGFGDRLDEAGVLQREEALGDRGI